MTVNQNPQTWFPLAAFAHTHTYGRQSLSRREPKALSRLQSAAGLQLQQTGKFSIQYDT